ncbi:unnamed protein product [Urochloa humidicola]
MALRSMRPNIHLLWATWYHRLAVEALGGHKQISAQGNRILVSNGRERGPTVAPLPFPCIGDSSPPAPSLFGLIRRKTSACRRPHLLRAKVALLVSSPCPGFKKISPDGCLS